MIPWWKADPAIETPPLDRNRLLSLVSKALPDAAIDPDSEAAEKRHFDPIQYILRGRDFFLHINERAVVLSTSAWVPKGIDKRRVLEYLYFSDPANLPALSVGMIDGDHPLVVIHCWQANQPGLSDEQLTAILPHWHEVMETFLHFYGQWIESEMRGENNDKGAGQ
ncbi:MAG: hypothetical protein Q4C87_00445 [Actinomycetaceae bacterium]|nr:hypothetical protein [Actinomycetaceae bacterium]